ncbi:hypothetical protein RB595_003331 [Gaeumannomyces hyphopodioides]
MPPASSQKGTGKKGAGSIARNRSRNTTPSISSAAAAAAAAPQPSLLPPVETIETEFVELKFEILRNITYEDLFDQGAGAASPVIPDSRALDHIGSRLQRLQDIVEKRGVSCDRGMRLLADKRNDRVEMDRIREEERLQREAEGAAQERRANKKKRKEKDSLAPHDTNIERSSPLRDPSSKVRKASRDDSSNSSLSPPIENMSPNAMEVDEKTKTAKDDVKDEEEESSSDDDGAPPPRPVPANQTFGEDPSTFPDPTVYEILPVTDGMSHEEICEIYSVATYPKSDLADLIAGDPPDKDFSSGKASNQISFSTFSTYTEPYFRPFNEEDLTFLRERGDRSTVFDMPKRGRKHYTEIWAEEDGAMAVDSGAGARDRLPANLHRGTIEHMNDNVAETDKLSVGPLLSRLLCAMRPEGRTQPPDGDVKPLVNGDFTNGVGTPGPGVDDGSFSGGYEISATGELVPIGGTPAPAPLVSQPSFISDAQMNGMFNGVDPLGSMSMGMGGGMLPNSQKPPAAYMPESSSEAWKKASHPKLDYSQVDERLKQELRHIGFLPLTDSSGATAGTAGGGGGTTNGIVVGGSGGAGSAGAVNGSNGQSSSSGGGAANGTASSAAAAAAAAADASMTADYDGGYDDEVAARLRLLQARLRDQMLVNGGRKARLMELVRERMAHQEYTTILEDLDTQVQQAYLKRNRTMGKGKAKKNRPGAAAAAATNGGTGGAAGMARPGIGDHAKTLMERRRRWIDNIGPIFEDDKINRVPRAADGPESNIFQPEVMASLVKQEKDTWDEEAED